MGLKRIFLEGITAHVIQRGNNRADIFHEPQDYEAFIGLLRRSSCCHAVHVHAFVLMTNHIHLLATPQTATSLPRAMQQVGVHYVQYYNRKYKRIGTLWNGRYRSILIMDEEYWVTCLRYIEQNPVRAGIVGSPADYRWSSYSAHAFGNGPAWLAPHPLYDRLGRTPETRQAAYRSICAENLSNQDLVIARQPLIVV